MSDGKGKKEIPEVTWIQKLFTAVLPKQWAEDMRSESEQWRIRCCACGYSVSVWEAGGIRWKAASVGKRTRLRCPHCGVRGWASVEKASF